MLAVVELVAVARLEHFEAIRAQKIDCILVQLTKVHYNITIERRTEIANLKKNNHIYNQNPSGCLREQSIAVWLLRSTFSYLFGGYLTHVGHFTRLVKVFHMMQKERRALERQFTDLAESYMEKKN